MIFLYIISSIALLISFSLNRQKSFKALKIAAKKFLKILPQFLIMIILISISLYFIPEKSIANYLNNKNQYLSMLSASIVGSIVVIPGFIAFPLGGILLKKGVTYSIIAAFTTSLMLVGILTFPLEKRFLGTKATLIRNILSFFIAIIVAIAIGIAYGELL